MDTISYKISDGPCPRCRKSGRDKHGDNLAEYSDGHKFCYGCGFFSPPNKIRALLHENGNTKKEAVGSPQHGARLSNEFTYVARKWLLKYKITPEVIERYGIKYNEVSSRICFTTPSGRICERNIKDNDGGPKWLSVRSKVEASAESDCWKSASGRAVTVLVEDAVSAIRICEAARTQVGRFTAANSLQGTAISVYAILGTNIPAKALYSLCTASDGIRVWLDRDKRDKALRIASRASQWSPDVRVIGSELDPKEYSDEEIRSFLEKTT